jgi:hypothetical protein
MRQLAAGVIVAAVVGLVPAEVAALILAALAFLVASAAFGVATAVRRSYTQTMERQSKATEALTSAAAEVEAKIRDS